MLRFSTGLGSPGELTFRCFASSLSLKSFAIIAHIKKEWVSKFQPPCFAQEPDSSSEKSHAIGVVVSDQEIIAMNGRPVKRSVSSVWFIASHNNCLSGTF